MAKVKRIVVVVQARMGSTRLPGKIMMNIEGEPMLWHVVNRLNHCELPDKVVVATSNARADDVVEKFCKGRGINIFRGSEDDVLARYYNAAAEYGADTVVRVTGDCPLIDPKIVDKTVLAYLNNRKDYDGASNVIERTYPRGLDTEVVSFGCLERCHKNASERYQREHVIIYIYEHPEDFKLYNVKNDINLSSLRWTVDEEADFKFVTEIYKRLYRDRKIFYMNDVLKTLDRDPSILLINRGIEQKSIK